LRAIADRSSGVMFRIRAAALAFPPRRPSATAAGFFRCFAIFQKGQSLSDWEISNVSSASLRLRGNFGDTVFFTLGAGVFKATFLRPAAGFFFLCLAMGEFYPMLKRCALWCSSGKAEMSMKLS